VRPAGGRARGEAPRGRRRLPRLLLSPGGGAREAEDAEDPGRAARAARRDGAPGARACEAGVLDLPLAAALLPAARALGPEGLRAAAAAAARWVSGEAMAALLCRQ
jgi:hypothetical protein